MLTTLSPSEQIIAEVNVDLPKAHYWGDKERNKRVNCEKLLAAIDEAVGGGRLPDRNIVTYEYRSKNGNKWLIFDSYVNGKFTYVLFAYRKTSAWMECMLPSVKDENQRMVLLFTPHFFQRLFEREGIDCRDMDTLGDFIRYTNAIYSDGWLDGELVFRLRNKGVILGKPRKDNENIVEMRTYISDATLSSSKENKYKELMTAADEDNESHYNTVKPTIRL